MSSTQQYGGDPGRLSGSLGLNVGPPLSSRQRKAAAAFTLAQLLALAELWATARRRQASGGRRSNDALAGCPANAARAPAGLAAISRLRQCTAKRRAEEAADAAAATSTRQHPAGTGSAQTAVSMKRITILPPPGSHVPAAQLGCHLARRCGGGGRGGGGGVVPSSLARVYGSQLRVGQLPDDYSECFVGLEPSRQVDADEHSLYGSSATAMCPAAVGGPGQAAPIGRSGDDLTAPPMGGALFGSVSVAEEMSFLFAANAVVPPGAAPVVPVIPGALPLPSGAPVEALAGAGAAAAGGLMAPFTASAGPALAGASMPYAAVHTHGGPLTAGFTSDPAAQAAAAAATVAAPDLMLDAEESSSSELEDEIGAGAGGRVWGSEAQTMLSQPRPGDRYGVGLSGMEPGGGAYGGFGEGMGLIAAAAGTCTGLVNGNGARGGLGPSGAAVDDDGEMVEEF